MCWPHWAPFVLRRLDTPGQLARQLPTCLIICLSAHQFICLSVRPLFELFLFFRNSSVSSKSRHTLAHVLKNQNFIFEKLEEAILTSLMRKNIETEVSRVFDFEYIKEFSIQTQFEHLPPPPSNSAFHLKGVKTDSTRNIERIDVGVPRGSSFSNTPSNFARDFFRALESQFCTYNS